MTLDGLAAIVPPLRSFTGKVLYGQNKDVLSEMFDKPDKNKISLDEYLDYRFKNVGVDPRCGVMLVKGEALLRLAEHDP